MTNARQTLIVLTPGFPENEADTTCLPFLQTHIVALSKTFPEIEIIILAFQYPYKKGTYNWRGIKVIAFDGRERPRLRRLSIWLQVWRTLAKLRGQKIVGLLSLWCTECALIGGYFGRRYGLKHAVWLCGQDAKAGNKYVQWLKPKPDELMAMSDFLKREFFKNYRILPAHVVPIGVDPAQFPDTSVQRDIDVLGAGSLIPLKQYDEFIKVIHRLSETMPGVRAEICGNGPEKSKLTSLIETLKLQNNVLLAGEVAHADVISAMQRAKVFLHTSNYEGFGTVCLEALYAGCHVVSFTKPMDADIPQWRHVADIDEMAEAVRGLLNGYVETREHVCPYLAEDMTRHIMEILSSGQKHI